MNSPPLDRSLDPDAAALSDRVLALVHHYGAGKKSAFIQQIVSKAALTGAGNNIVAPGDWWQIYHRLCDFGLITEIGRGADLSWQWIGDRLSALPTNEVVFPGASSRIPAFQLLRSRMPFQEEVVCRLGLTSAEDFSLSFWVSTRADNVLHFCRKEQLPITVSVNSSVIGYLPSAQDVFHRAANPSHALPDQSDIERRGASSDRWLPPNGNETESAYLLRQARIDSPGYRYWLVDARGNQSYEMLSSDWLPLLLWWMGCREWPIRYNLSESVLSLPARLFYMLPSLVRHALLLPTLRWPLAVPSGSGQDFQFKGISRTDFHKFARLYAPAVRGEYVK